MGVLTNSFAGLRKKSKAATGCMLWIRSRLWRFSKFLHNVGSFSLDLDANQSLAINTSRPPLALHGVLMVVTRLLCCSETYFPSFLLHSSLYCS